jgi:RNA polymerase sigma-70 factor (ECF subfamily)
LAGTKYPMTPGVEIRSAEADLIDRLRSGDEAAFVCLVRTYAKTLKHLALAFVSSDALAEEVVQETWLAVLTGIARFEGRSSVKTWIFKILVNRAKTRAIREKRTINFSELYDPLERDEPAVDPARFLPVSHPTWPGHWTSPLDKWSASAEDAVLGRETMGVLHRELDRLPPAQRVVVALRDVQGWPAAEVCDLLGLSEANQRVLLHRGRSRLRGVLEDYFKDNA